MRILLHWAGLRLEVAHRVSVCKGTLGHPLGESICQETVSASFYGLPKNGIRKGVFSIIYIGRVVGTRRVLHPYFGLHAFGFLNKRISYLRLTCLIFITLT